MEEAEAAAQGYVAGTMEADGFAYDGAAVYAADTNVCLRVYGDYPDEKAQAQAATYAAEHDRDAELPAFLDEHLIEAILLDDGGASIRGRRYLRISKTPAILPPARNF